jgi:hypothetical protein
VVRGKAVELALDAHLRRTMGLCAEDGAPGSGKAPGFSEVGIHVRCRCEYPIGIG